MSVSTSSIFSPERRPYNAFQSPFLSWARSEHGIRIRKHTNAALRIFKPLSFLHTQSHTEETAEFTRSTTCRLWPYFCASLCLPFWISPSHPPEIQLSCRYAP